MRALLTKQSKVPGIHFNTGTWAWEVSFRRKGAKENGENEENEVRKTNRSFPISKWMEAGLDEASADSAALQAATEFRSELVKDGLLTEPKSGEFISAVPGVHWNKAKKKWVVQIRTKAKKFIAFFVSKAEAERKAKQVTKRPRRIVGKMQDMPKFEPKTPCPGVTWNTKAQCWHAQVRDENSLNKAFRVKPKDHSEVELDRSFNQAVEWRQSMTERKTKVEEAKEASGFGVKACKRKQDECHEKGTPQRKARVEKQDESNEKGTQQRKARVEKQDECHEKGTQQRKARVEKQDESNEKGTQQRKARVEKQDECHEKGTQQRKARVEKQDECHEKGTQQQKARVEEAKEASGFGVRLGKRKQAEVQPAQGLISSLLRIAAESKRLREAEARTRNRQKEAAKEACRIVSLRRSAFKALRAWGLAVLDLRKSEPAHVQTQYRRLMRTLHPDRVGSSPDINLAIERVKEAKEACELLEQLPPQQPCDFRFEVLETHTGSRKFRLRWAAPRQQSQAGVEKYIISVYDPVCSRFLTIASLQPDYLEETRSYIGIDQLTSFSLFESDWARVFSSQTTLRVRVAAANKAGQSQWACLNIPL